MNTYSKQLHVWSTFDSLPESIEGSCRPYIMQNDKSEAIHNRLNFKFSTKVHTHTLSTLVYSFFLFLNAFVSLSKLMVCKFNGCECHIKVIVTLVKMSYITQRMRRKQQKMKGINSTECLANREWNCQWCIVLFL